MLFFSFYPFYFLTILPHDEQKAASGNSLAPQYIQYTWAATGGKLGGGGGIWVISSAFLSSYQPIIARIPATIVRIPPMAGAEIPPKMKHNIAPVLRSPFRSFSLAMNKVKNPKINDRMPTVITPIAHGNRSRIPADPLYAIEIIEIYIPDKKYIEPRIVDRIAPINVNISAFSTLLMFATSTAPLEIFILLIWSKNHYKC